jgi:hypothetical protein
MIWQEKKEKECVTLRSLSLSVLCPGLDSNADATVSC